jgi:hypothetical protein
VLNIFAVGCVLIAISVSALMYPTVEIITIIPILAKDIVLK